MSRFLVAVLGALLMVMVGCQSEDKSDSKSGEVKASADVCSHCPGAQKATADGKCPVCGAKPASSSSADECPVCPGTQTASAAGKCAACGAEVAKK